jgi:hypothetical protein
MQTKDDINHHSFIMIEKLSKDIEMLRQRTHDIGQRLSVQDYTIADGVKANKKILTLINENRELIEKLNVESFSRRAVLDFIGEKLSSTKTLIILFCAFIVIEAFSITPIIFKHALGWN